MREYDEQLFKAQMDAALRRIKTILDNTRSPATPADVPHRYDDKFLLAEIATTLAVAAALHCLEVLGLSGEGLAQLRAWAKTRSVTLRLAAQETCRFDREEVRKIESPEHVTEVHGTHGDAKRTEKVVVTVTDYLWTFDFGYELFAYQGNAPDNAVALLTRKGTVAIKTGAKTTPRPHSVVRPPLDLDVTWLLQQLDDEGRPRFSIDRAASTCRTPRRNRPIDAAFAAFDATHAWCERACAYFLDDLVSAQPDHGRDLSALDASSVFVPVVPVLESGEHVEGASLFPASQLGAFLDEERRSLAEKCRALAVAFPRDASIVTASLAGLLVTLRHLRDVAAAFGQAVGHLEHLLRTQLKAAVGKELASSDFGAYMDFHHRRLVREAFRPVPFSYAVRRPDHDPEGVVGLEVERDGATAMPISTTVATRRAARPMTFALDASTRVSFLGERHLHAWVSHRFSSERGVAASLVARARQFSSFILLVGRVASADVFEPMHGVVLTNKDVLKIPLLLEEIPTPKQFRDAIESLSPEQQAFAKAFRGMQLESTLFALCIIQIKPQLEKLLKLPPDGLTKEIKLTQELLSLITEYQIPSDLLSYDGPDEAAPSEKIARVAEYARRMREMIDLSKQRELDEEREREAMRLAETNRSHPAPPMFAPGGPPAMGMGFGGPPPPMPAMAAPVAVGAARGGPVPKAPAMRAAPAPAAAPPAPSPAAPPAQATETGAQRASRARSVAAGGAPVPAGAGDALDYTKLPAELDAKVEALDEDAALHASIIHPGEVWSRTAHKSLLTAPVTTRLGPSEQKTEKAKAFDLLDALTKSGALGVDEASLHVVLAATHAFDKTLVDTVVQDNVNPIEKVERSLLIFGTTVFRVPAREMLAEDQRDRVFAASPRLLGEGEEG